MVLTSRGGVRGSFGYDGSVYYAASDALLHGRLPYRDFLLLHPPGIVLALAPFAAMGRLLGDHVGFMLGNTAIALLASLNAGLVVVLARRLHRGRWAALAGGLFYATWFGAVQGEFSARLEPVGSALFLGGLLCVLAGPAGRLRLLAGGALLGLTVSVKVWWVVPVLVVLVAQAVQRRRAVAPEIGGVLAAAAVVDLPFLLAAPRQMLRMVAADQLGRSASGYSRLHRLGDLATIHQAFPDIARTPLLLGLALVGVFVLGAARGAWSGRSGRLPVVLVAAQLVVLVAAPTYFPFYAAYLAVSLALLVAAAAGSAKRVARVSATALLAGAVALSAVAGLIRTPSITAPFRGAGVLARGVAHVPCLVSDSPMALIELDALSRGLAHPSCLNWVDISGRTYDVDAPPDGRDDARLHNAVWQADLRRYLLSGDAVVLFRGDTGVDPATLAAIRSRPVLARAGRLTVYRVR